MKKFYTQLERIFEKVTLVFTTVISNSIIFVLALAMIIFWFWNRDYTKVPTNEVIRDVIHGTAFLTLFILQKAFNHFTASLHVKLDEILLGTKNADNEIINAESKSELEIEKLNKKQDNPIEKDKTEKSNWDDYSEKKPV